MMANLAIAIPPIPRETARAAKAVFGHANFYVLVGEQLGAILEDIHLDCILDVARDRWTMEGTLPLITFFQFIEGLTDAQAADAVRTRIEWKFALHLPVYVAGFNEIELCEFRHMSVTDPACLLAFQKLIDQLFALRPTVDNKGEHPGSAELFLTVCSVNRWNWAFQAMCQALEALAGKYPDWLRQVALPHWYGRYNHLSPTTASGAAIGQRELSMQDINLDIDHLIVELIRLGNREMNGLQEVKALYRIWAQQFKQWSEPRPHQLIGLTSKDCESCFKNAG